MKKELKTIPELTKRHKDILLYGEYLNEHLAKLRTERDKQLANIQGRYAQAEAIMRGNK